MYNQRRRIPIFASIHLTAVEHQLARIANSINASRLQNGRCFEISETTFRYNWFHNWRRFNISLHCRFVMLEVIKLIEKLDCFSRSHRANRCSSKKLFFKCFWFPFKFLTVQIVLAKLDTWYPVTT